MSIIKEIIERWSKPTNSFWQWMTRYSFILAVLASFGLEVIPQIMDDQYLPDGMKAVSRIIYGLCFGVSLAGKLTKIDFTPPQEEVKNVDENPEIH